MTALRYGLLGLPIATLGLPFYIYVPVYLAESLGYGFAAVGFVFLLARIFDVLTDIPIGVWVDRGANVRKIMTSGAALCGLAAAAFVLLPHPMPTFTLVLLVCVIFLSWTMMVVPWLSLPVKLAEEGEAQLALNSSREAFLLVGTFVALVAPAFLSANGLVAALVVVGLALLLCIAILPLHPPLNRGSTARASVPGWLLLKEVSVRQLALPWFINALANAIPGTVLLIFTREVLGDETVMGKALAVYFLAAIIGMPLWYVMAKRFGELRVWKTTIIIATFAFAGAFFLGNGDGNVFLVICVVSGLTLGGDQAMPASLQTHLARELMDYYNGDVGARLLALWSLIQKAAMGLAVALSFLWLGWNTNDAGEVSPWAISMAYVVFPVVLKFLALWVLHRGELHTRLLGTFSPSVS